MIFGTAGYDYSAFSKESKEFQAQLDSVLLELNNKMAKQTNAVRHPKASSNITPISIGVSGEDPPLDKSEYNVRYTSLQKACIIGMDFAVNQGYYLEGTFVSEPWQMRALNQLLKDQNGNLARVCFYDVAEIDNWGYLAKEFRKGRKIIILHPFYKKAGDGMPSIRIESSLEYRFVDYIEDFEKLLQKSIDLKNEGNNELKKDQESAKKKYIQSAEELIKKIPKFIETKEEFCLEWKMIIGDAEKRIAQQHLAIVFSNLSLIYLQTKSPLMALYYARYSIWCDPKFFKANLRIAAAMVELGYVFEVLKFLEDIKKGAEGKKFASEISGMMKEINTFYDKFDNPKTFTDELFQMIMEWPIEKSYLGPIEIAKNKAKDPQYRSIQKIYKDQILLIQKGFISHTDQKEVFLQVLEKANQKEELVHYWLRNGNKEALDKGQEKELATILKSSPKKYENLSKEEVGQLFLLCGRDSLKLSQGSFGYYPGLHEFIIAENPETEMLSFGDFVIVRAKQDIPKGNFISIPRTIIALD